MYPITPNRDVRKDLRLPCYLLNTHSVHADFCGREDVLERLAAELLPSKNVVSASGTSLRQFALCGFGGIGKTEIAREFARRHKDYFDAVFWVVADEIAKLDHHYQQISLALGLEDASECKSLVVTREVVKGWLSNPQRQLVEFDEIGQPSQAICEATWLLIFDNADDPMVLADYWPQGSGSILITSRDPLAKTMFTSRASGFDLGPLSQRDSLSLFNHLTANFNEQEEDTARHISDALGGVPLAISQMAGIIRRQDLTLAEFFELYTDHEEHASLYETKFDSSLVTYRHSLSSVWAFEKLKPQARRLLELIAFLDPDVIEEDMLMAAAAKLLSEGAQFRKSNYIEARTDLMQSSLVRRDKQKQHISVHRIVQDAIFAAMEPARKSLVFDQVVRMLWAEWPSAMPKPSKEPELPQPKSTGGRLHVERWPVCAALYPHVLRMHQLWSTISNLSETTSLLFAKLLTEAAWYAEAILTVSIHVLIVPGTKKNADAQSSSTAFSNPLNESASPQLTQTGILCLRISSFAKDLSPWIQTISKQAALTRSVPLTWCPRFAKSLGEKTRGYTLPMQSEGSHVFRIGGTKKVKLTSRRRFECENRLATTSPGQAKLT